MPLKWNATQNGMSLKMESHSKWNVPQKRELTENYPIGDKMHNWKFEIKDWGLGIQDWGSGENRLEYIKRK